MTPAVAALRWLREFGFAGQRVFNTSGNLDAVYYTRTYQGLREVVLVYSETEALAYRARDVLDDTDPLYAPPTPWNGASTATSSPSCPPCSR